MKSDYIKPEQMEFMLRLMARDNANAIRISIHTGLRIGDVLRLKRSDVGADGTITTVCQKTNKNFVGKIPMQLLRVIMNCNADSEWLFPSPDSRRRGKPRTRQAVWHDIKKAAKTCAVNRNVTPHSARKVYAVDKFRQSGLEEAQRALQHDNLETTLIYAFADILGEAKPPTDTKKQSEPIGSLVSLKANGVGDERSDHAPKDYARSHREELRLILLGVAASVGESSFCAEMIRRGKEQIKKAAP